jgi:beta-ureidopropionase / N-carbamoyl-L-amino-acid hydrolase
MEWRATDGVGIKQQYRGQLAPMGMIFVPSRDGISHSPKESTAWVDVGTVSDGGGVLWGVES